MPPSHLQGKQRRRKPLQVTAATTKRCSDCSVVMDAVLFWKNARSKDGRYGHCKPCSHARVNRWKATEVVLAAGAYLARYRKC